MTMDDELILIKKTNEMNEVGDIETTETRTTVLCGVQSVKCSEHYVAEAHGYKPEIVLSVNQYDYDDQEDVEHNGVAYKVIRSYKINKYKSLADFENIELICQRI